jgi:valyl-tRNA synthetase
LRLIKSWETGNEIQIDEGRASGIKWIQSRLSGIDTELSQLYGQFRLSEGVTALYSFVWDDFCSIFLEIIKPAYGEKVDPASLEATTEIFEEICKLLHPFMPFITEEIWHQLRPRTEGDDCIIAQRNKQAAVADEGILNMMSHILIVKSAVLELRNQYQLSPKETISIYHAPETDLSKLWKVPGARAILLKLANATIEEGESDATTNGKIAFLAGKYQYTAALQIEIDKKAELKRMNEELNYYRGFITSVEKKLNNEKFVSNASPEVVEKERQKQADGLSKIEQLQKSIAQLSE